MLVYDHKNRKIRARCAYLSPRNRHVKRMRIFLLVILISFNVYRFFVHKLRDVYKTLKPFYDFFMMSGKCNV